MATAATVAADIEDEDEEDEGASPVHELENLNAHPMQETLDSANEAIEVSHRYGRLRVNQTKHSDGMGWDGSSSKKGLTLRRDVNRARHPQQQGMDNAIQSIRDWQTKHSDEIAELEEKHKKMLDEVRTNLYSQQTEEDGQRCVSPSSVMH